MDAADDGYQLGIDLGTTYTAAAVMRAGQVRMVGLGNRSAAIPSVLHLAADGTVLVGTAADRRGPVEPDRVAREFKRRIGDPTPILLGGSPVSAEAVTAELIAHVVDKVSEVEGGPPAAVAVTRPANWGTYKSDLLDQAVGMAGTTATSLTEPEAAAIAYAANERVAVDSLIVVYDFGGGTFDVAVLRKRERGFALLGRPDGVERLGGVDLDEAVVGHVRTSLGAALARLDFDDPAVLAALARLRQDCVDAKEALSTDTEVAIPVMLPDVHTEVRLTRAEFEALIRPTVRTTIAATRRAMASAQVQPADVATLLLVGGSSRIPLVAELVSEEFGRPVAVDAHPKHVVALGAARSIAPTADAGVDPLASTTIDLRSGGDLGLTPVDDAMRGTVDDAAMQPYPEWLVGDTVPRRRSTLVAAAVLLVVVLALGGAVLASGVGRSDAKSADLQSPTVTATDPPTAADGSAVLPAGSADERSPAPVRPPETRGAEDGNDGRPDRGTADAAAGTSRDRSGSRPARDDDPPARADEQSRHDPAPAPAPAPPPSTPDVPDPPRDPEPDREPDPDAPPDPDPPPDPNPLPDPLPDPGPSEISGAAASSEPPAVARSGPQAGAGVSSETDPAAT